MMVLTLDISLFDRIAKSFSCGPISKLHKAEPFRQTLFAFIAAAGTLASGCANLADGGSAQLPASVACPYAPEAPAIDGRLDDAIWKTATSYRLQIPADAVDFSGKPASANPTEEGFFKVAYDENNFYLAVSFTDSDLIAKGTSDGQLHYKYGDVAELFLWPEDQTWYWELYVTPKSMQSSFFYPGGGRATLEEHLKNNFEFTAKAAVEGTLDDWSDRDAGWSAEMAVPVSELTKRGGGWGPGQNWRILVSRYNFSRWLLRPELSSFPLFPRANFHLRGCYAPIEFKNKESGAAPAID